MVATLSFCILYSFLTPSLVRSLRRQDNSEGDSDTSTCSQWNTKACSGSECYTCGQRIEYMMKSKGQSRAQAGQTVANEFPSECGSCGGSSGGNNGGLGGTGEHSGGGSISSAGYSSVWSDEFNGQTIDSSKWKLVDLGYGFGNKELQWYRPQNAWVSGGTLKIKAKKETHRGHSYTSAKLETKQIWTYGKFSVRARLQQCTARGTWPAHWMLPNDTLVYGSWPRSGEIDIFEHVGFNTGTVHGTVHTMAFNHLSGSQRGGKTRVDVKGWHTYTVEWREDIILFAADNRVYYSFKRQPGVEKWPFDPKNPFKLILNVAVGGTWGGSKGVDEGAFTGEGQIMEIDWVRVEQKGGARQGPPPPPPTWSRPVTPFPPPPPTWSRPVTPFPPPPPPPPTWSPPSPSWPTPTSSWPTPSSPTPSPPAPSSGNCFPPTALVRVEHPETASSTKDAERPLAELRAGDPLLSETAQPNMFVLDFHDSAHDRNTSLTKYLRIEHAMQKHERPLLVTANHLVFVVAGAKEAAKAIPASEIRPGHAVLVLSSDASKDPGKLIESRVTSVGSLVLRGFAAPLSSSGTLFVEGVLVSSYALLSDAQLALWQRGPAILRENTHSICHVLAGPFRWMHALGWGSGYLSALSAVFDALSVGVSLFRTSIV